MRLARAEEWQQGQRRGGHVGFDPLAVALAIAIAGV